jgi:hypothetical protein
MKSMFNKDDVEAMKARVEKLDFQAPARWGSFNAHGMICHLTDALKYPLGMIKEVKELEKGPPMFIRHLLRLYVPIPKARVQANPVMLTTKPAEWEKDKALLLELIDRFLENRDKEEWPRHSFFGPLKGIDWAKVTVRHMNHHLSQFGV